MNAPMACPYAHHDGAYVLGALPPAERLEFERHLAGCDDCTRAVRELAGLPGLLGRIDPGLLEQPDRTEPLPETLLPALSREVRRDRRRRAVAGLALAAAAVALVVGLVVAVVQGDDASPAVTGEPGTSQVAAETMDPVGDVPVRARLSVEQVPWGTKLGLTCTYDTESVDYELPPAVDYWLVVRTRDGRTEKVGSWRSVDGKTMQFSAGTATDREDISSVEVRAPGGRVVLRLAV